MVMERQRIIVNYEKCTGCAACSNICPKKAIRIQESLEGFCYPIIDSENCIGCGKCKQVCQCDNELNLARSIGKCYAAWASEEIKMKSSSGGVFSLLAKYIIQEKNGFVCGAAFVDSTQVKHIIVDIEEEIVRLRNSKYIQSEIGNTYHEIKILLNEGRQVLFTGTPCQIAGLYHYLGSEPENLYTIDILCHGVPSQKMFNKYISEEFQGENVKFINFRDKSRGWTYQLRMKLETDKKIYSLNINESPYYKAFVKSMCLRRSCYQCDYSSSHRLGDITLGDFWRIWDYSRSLDDRKGTSVVLINSIKGKKLFQAIHLQKVEEVPFEYALKGNHTLSEPTKMYPKRDEFMNYVENHTLRQGVRKYTESGKRCGIVNYWWSYGHGAALTAFALSKVLSEQGFYPCLITTPTKNYDKKCEDGINYHFIKEHVECTTVTYTKYSDYKKLNNQFDHFILGSDQVFRLEWIPDEWMFNMIDYRKNILAVSASFGIDKINNSKSRIKGASYYLSRFNAISLRELDGIEVYKKYFSDKKELEVIIDPVFLVEPEVYSQIIDEEANIRESDYVFFYILDYNNEIDAIKKKIEKNHKIKIVQSNPELKIEDFLYYMKNSRMIVTDSFHGICFAIIFNKPFYCIYNPYRGISRMDSLGKLFELEKEIFIDYNEAKKCDFVQPIIDYDKINAIIDKERKKGIKWIVTNLQSPTIKRKRNYCSDRLKINYIRLNNWVVGRHIRIKKHMKQKRYGRS